MCVSSYVHSSVDFGYSLIIQRELVDLDTVADKLTHDFDLELVQLALTDGVSFSNDRNDVHLWQDGTQTHFSSSAVIICYLQGLEKKNKIFYIQQHK